MEGFRKCKQDEQYTYYKCKNQKSKGCQAIAKEDRITLEFSGTGHNGACRKDTLRKSNNSVLSNSTNQSMINDRKERNVFNSNQNIS
jgi:hypothetical protein